MTNTEIINLIQEQITTLQQMKRKLQLEDFTTSEHPELELYLVDDWQLYVVVRDNASKPNRMDSVCKINVKDMPHNPIGIVTMYQVGIREDSEYAWLEKFTTREPTIRDFPKQIQELIFEAVTEYIPEETA